MIHFLVVKYLSVVDYKETMDIHECLHLHLGSRMEHLLGVGGFRNQPIAVSTFVWLFGADASIDYGLETK